MVPFIIILLLLLKVFSSFVPLSVSFLLYSTGLILARLFFSALLFSHPACCVIVFTRFLLPFPACVYLIPVFPLAGSLQFQDLSYLPIWYVFPAINASNNYSFPLIPWKSKMVSSLCLNLFCRLNQRHEIHANIHSIGQWKNIITQQMSKYVFMPLLCKLKSKRKSNLTAALSDQIKPCLLCDTCVESHITLELLIKYFTVLSNLTQNTSVGGSRERFCNQSCTKADKKSKYTQSEKRWADKQKLLKSNICYQYNVTILTKLYIFLTWYQLNIFECLFCLEPRADAILALKPGVTGSSFSNLKYPQLGFPSWH